jgi:hypothetical protein
MQKIASFTFDLPGVADRTAVENALIPLIWEDDKEDAEVHVLRMKVYVLRLRGILM